MNSSCEKELAGGIVALASRMDLLMSGTVLVVQSVVRRPYVFGFLVAYVVAASRDLGWRRSGGFGLWTFGVAWVAEFLSTRVGVPFGLYHYTESTRGQELYLANVPLFDSLSFVFLAYAAYCLARSVLGRAGGVGVVVLSALAMMALDLVIDPLAVRGDRWFLGRIFYYPEAGPVFGVPLSNFVGWVIVGGVSVGGFLLAGGGRRASTRSTSPAGRPAAGVVLYYAVLAFNLAVAWWIDEPAILALGLVVHGSLSLSLWGWYACGVRAPTLPTRWSSPGRYPA